MNQLRSWKGRLVILFVAFSAAFCLFQFTPVRADSALPQEDYLGVRYGEQSGLTNTDLRITVARIINGVLGILGTLATGLIFYAGFLWMTAAGNEEKTETARKIIIASVIGLLIIMASYSISRFIIYQSCRATGGGFWQNNDAACNF